MMLAEIREQAPERLQFLQDPNVTIADLHRTARIADPDSFSGFRDALKVAIQRSTPSAGETASKRTETPAPNRTERKRAIEPQPDRATTPNQETATRDQGRSAAVAAMQAQRAGAIR